MKKLVCLGVAALASLVSLPSIAEAGATRFRLLCQSTSGYSVIADVDLSSQTVNGVKAAITDTDFKWAVLEWDRLHGRNINYDYSISRLTGVYSSIGRGIFYAGPPPLMICAPAPVAKF